MRPDASLHNPDPDYLYGLIKRAGARLNARDDIRETARLIGVDPRALRRMVNGEIKIPYSVQFALECLAAESDPDPKHQ